MDKQKATELDRVLQVVRDQRGGLCTDDYLKSKNVALDYISTLIDDGMIKGVDSLIINRVEYEVTNKGVAWNLSGGYLGVVNKVIEEKREKKLWDVKKILLTICISAIVSFLMNLIFKYCL